MVRAPRPITPLNPAGAESKHINSSQWLVDWQVFARVYLGGDGVSLVKMWDFFIEASDKSLRRWAIVTSRPTTMTMRLMCRGVGVEKWTRLVAMVDTGCSYSLMT